MLILFNFFRAFSVFSYTSAFFYSYEIVNAFITLLRNARDLSAPGRFPQPAEKRAKICAWHLSAHSLISVFLHLLFKIVQTRARPPDFWIAPRTAARRAAAPRGERIENDDENRISLLLRLDIYVRARMSFRCPRPATSPRLRSPAWHPLDRDARRYYHSLVAAQTQCTLSHLWKMYLRAK